MAKKKQTIYCPRPHSLKNSQGYLEYLPCNKRDCVCVSCREHWANRMARVLIATHRKNPFNYVCRFTPIQTNVKEMLAVIKKVINQTSKWCEHNNQWLDYYIVPEQQTKIHWNGVLRCSSPKVKKVICYFWNKAKQGKYSHSIVEPNTKYGAITYCVKWNRQHKITPVKSQGNRLILRSKFIFRKGE